MPHGRKFIHTLLLIATCIAAPMKAQESCGGELSMLAQFNNTSAWGSNVPYWLLARRQGLASPELHNGYMRLAATYGNKIDKKGAFKYRFTADIIGGYNQQNAVSVQQAYGEISWRWLTLHVGSKERFGENKGDDKQFLGTSFASNNVNRYFGNIYNAQITDLNSGGLTYSGNSKPIPQVRLEVPEYTTIAKTGNWLQMRGHIAYGRFTDDNFQRDFAQGNNITRYGRNILYHSKAAFIKIGNPGKFPLEIEGGGEMYSQFGGDIYKYGRGLVVSMPASFSDYLKAFIPLSGSEDTPLDEQTNISGNQIGSWHAALTLHTKAMDIRLYGEHMYEDFSQLFFLEYQSNKEGVRRVIFYPWKDIMAGIRLTNKSGKLPFISALQYEFMGTYDQSGALYHDPSSNFNEQMDGVDNYYNHGIYPGWHHWGMGMGSPLVLSPIYNKDGDLAFKSNRLISHNVGINGCFGKQHSFAYRLQYTYSEHWGTYLNPLDKKAYITSLLGELVYAPRGSYWAAGISLGYDRSSYIGNNFGFMLSITRVSSIIFGKRE